MEVLVSVVLPTYKRLNFLKSALASVLQQTYPQFECIVVNDFPPMSLEVEAVIISFNDDRIKLVHHEKNMNIGQARNTGIQLAKGTILAFLDDDDTWYPEYLEKNVEAHSKYPDAGIIYSGYLRKWIDGTLSSAKVPAPVPPAGNVAKAMLRGDFTMHNGSVVTAKAECFERVGLFDTEVSTFEDWDMWYRICLEYEIAYIDEILMVYSHHLGNRGSSNMERRLAGLSKAREKYANEADFKPFYDKFEMYAYYYEIKGRVLAGNRKGVWALLLTCISTCNIFTGHNFKTLIKMLAILILGRQAFIVINN